ncbi:hypothetical protein GCM10010519_34810 [Streptomyces lactacystinicus]
MPGPARARARPSRKTPGPSRGPDPPEPNRSPASPRPGRYRLSTCLSPASTAKSSRLPGGGKGQMKWSEKAHGGR